MRAVVRKKVIQSIRRKREGFAVGGTGPGGLPGVFAGAVGGVCFWLSALAEAGTFFKSFDFGFEGFLPGFGESLLMIYRISVFVAKCKKGTSVDLEPDPKVHWSVLRGTAFCSLWELSAQ